MIEAMRMRSILLTLAAACFLNAACGGDKQQQRPTVADNANATANQAPDPKIPSARPNTG